jgi:16S rRNA (guanine527-N7)-methyltransferase
MHELIARDKIAALAMIPVSRETAERLDILVNQVLRWQPVKNLVSSNALPELWTRHVADSLQLLELAPDARRWLDLGSGAGFPALVIAAARAGDPDFRLDLVESNTRKCAFMREVARLMQVGVTIHNGRIEDVMPQFVDDPVGPPVDVVSARALAGLPQLMAWCGKLLTKGVVGLFPKGKDAGFELTETAKYWRLEYTIHNSLTDPAGQVLRITQAEMRAPDGAGASGGQVS